MYKKTTHIHFMGIGGIGMSAIAKILRLQGYRVSGCDLDMNQKSIKQLKEIGCEITNAHDTALCKDLSIDILVYSSAIKQTHPEIIRARERHIPVIQRATMLAELMRTKHSIAIAGAHGKTTTTSMISHILMQTELDPTVIIGGHLKNIGTNAYLGKGDFIVAEADESDRSFLNFNPTLAVITNIDLEHLDTYKDLDDIIATFKQFLNNIPFYGKAILCIDDPVIRSILPSLSHLNIITYGLCEDADINGSNIILERTFGEFTVKAYNKLCGIAKLQLTGQYNIQNALGAIAVMHELDIPFTTTREALATFQGVERRFSLHGTYRGAEIFDDYAHHPKEIASVLKVARQRAEKRLIVVFQPHRFSRTHHLWNQFIETFLSYQIDELIITDIFPASEQPIEGVTSNALVQSLQSKNRAFNSCYIPFDEDFENIILHLNKIIQAGDLILLLGAGKIYQIPYRLN